MALSDFFPLCFLLLLSHGVVGLQASHFVANYNHLQAEPKSSPEGQPYRTAFHFQPPKNWMNDPNGPMIYKGIYHLFYQYNPKGAIWGNIVWAHSTSMDLVNWDPHEAAIYRSQPSDINGCWSGSTTILPSGKPAILYTGINPQNHQVQNLAIPENLSDPYLTKWVKSPKNPLISPTPQNGINSRYFRDPTTAWLGPDKQWRVIVGNKLNAQGRALLYKSKDFINWVESEKPLHSVDNNGMWECPDFYPVSRDTESGVDTSVLGPNIKHVLKVSLDDKKHEYYTLGTYDAAEDVFVPDDGSVENDSGLRYDYGKFYASKTFFDRSKKRRVLLGWINESSLEADNIKKGWSGVQAIPRKVWLDKTGKQLVQWPVEEVEKLRLNHVSLQHKLLEGGSTLQISGVIATQADVEISFEISEIEKAGILDLNGTNPDEICSQNGAYVKGSVGPFGLLVLASEGLQEYTAVFFRIFKGRDKYVVLMCSDQSRSSLDGDNDMSSYGTILEVDPLQKKLALRTLIDHSIVESFEGEGNACITARVYPTQAIGDGAHLYAFNNGTEPVTITHLSAWSMKKAKIN